MIRVYAADWVLPVAAQPVREGAVAVAGGAIIAVGPRADVLAACPEAPIEDFGAAVLAPGFVNAHTHLEYATYGGHADGADFASWLAAFVRRQRASSGLVRAAADLGALACLRSGTSTIADCSHAGESVPAAREAGLRAIVHLETFGIGDPGPGRERLERAIERWQPEARGLVTLGVSPHAPYTVGPELLRAVRALADEHGLRLAIHVAESRAEVAAVRDGRGAIVEALAELGAPAPPHLGRHPVAALCADGILDSAATAIHCVQVGPAELELLAASGAAVVHCPRSNAQLGCGFAPLAELRAAGIRVGLGTDSPASALDFDVFAELRTAIAVARGRAGRADALGADDALRLATLDAAEALGLRAVTGSLETGKRADLAVVALGDSPHWPTDDPAAALVYGGSPERVLATLVDGVVRYRKEQDARRYESAVRRACEARARALDEVVTT